MKDDAAPGLPEHVSHACRLHGVVEPVTGLSCVERVAGQGMAEDWVVVVVVGTDLSMAQESRGGGQLVVPDRPMPSTRTDASTLRASARRSTVERRGSRVARSRRLISVGWRSAA